MDKEELKEKIGWVKSNDDINYQGESEDFRLGFVTALEWILENQRDDLK